MSFSYRHARITGVAVAALALTAFFGSVPAYAHDSVSSTSPSDGATVTANPGKVSITLTQAPDTKLPGSNIIKVTAPDGHVVSTGNITADGSTLSIGADIDHPGKHTVDWRAVSADGHPIEGTFSFTYAGNGATTPAAAPAVTTAPAAAPTTPGATTEPAAAPASQTSSDNTGLLIGAGAVIVILAGVIIYLVTRRNKTTAE